MDITVVKVGGAVLENEASLEDFLERFAALPRPKLLVHGGGRGANVLAEKLGLEPKFHNGRRITDEHMLEVVTMSYTAQNKKIVGKLQAKNQRAIGLSGADLNLITVSKRPSTNGLDFGYVGDIEEIQTNWLGVLFNKGVIPVICPITCDENGQLYNTNADTIASQIAIKLANHKNWDTRLFYCFEKSGVLQDSEDEDSLIPKLNPKKYREMAENEEIHTGMIPKMDNAFKALKNNVSEVRILSYKDLMETDPGTKLTKR
jgi:acetylglutamate kinase